MGTRWGRKVTRFEARRVRDQGFLGGILTACLLLNAVGEDTLVEELADSVGFNELAQYAKRNGEYADSGLKKLAANRRLSRLAHQEGK